MRTASNIISALGLFSFEAPEWTVDDASQELGLGRSTTYRYFKVLADAGLIVAFRSGRYILGPAITQLDRQVRLVDPLIAAARANIREIVGLLPKPAVVLICRLYRDRVMCVFQKSVGEQHRTVSYERGKLMSLHRGAASKIILAHLSARYVKSYSERYSAEMAEAGLGNDWQEVRGALRVLRNRGIAVTQGELDPGVIGIAAPLFDADDNIIGSVSAVLTEDLDEDVLASCYELIRSSAQVINAEFVSILLEK